MDHLDFSENPQPLLSFDAFDPNDRQLFMSPSNTWPPLSLHHQHQPNLHQQSPQHPQQHHNHDSLSHQANQTADDFDPNSQMHRANTSPSSSSPSSTGDGSRPLPATTTAPLQTTGLTFNHHHALDASAALLTNAEWQSYQLNHSAQQSFFQNAGMNPSSFGAAYAGALQTSPIEYSMPTSQALNNSLSSTAYLPVSAPMDNNLTHMHPFQMTDFHSELIFPVDGDMSNSAELIPAGSSVAGSSPSGSWVEIRSLSSSDNGWNPSFESYGNDSGNGNICNPNQFIHNRADSESNSSHHSDGPQSALSTGSSFDSYEVVFPMNSPSPENNVDFSQGHQAVPQAQMPPARDFHSPPSHLSVSPPAGTAEPVHISQPPSSSTSPSSSAHSPPSRVRKSVVGAKTDKVAKTIVKKPPPHSTKKDSQAEKRVGRRRGPLRPDQRQQAHEIRKLRACLRCKFLKKTCDVGDPCAGCQPSHARLWQVPCTRIDIKDIAYFMKDWKADYERHVSLGFSVGNIKGFSTMERQLFITHGYGFFLPISAREVYVRDDKCFGVDWIETLHESPKGFVSNTAKLSAGIEGVSHKLLSEYLDRHIDGGYERFIDEYFEGTYFVTEILKTAYRFYLREKLPVIRKALKLVLAYNLTLHVTMVEGLSEEDGDIGFIDDSSSKFYKKTVAPVMINFQVKCALADMWRELQKDVLEELSALYSSVYSGEKLKNWPTIFMLAAILLCVWELMQFDCHYRVPDEKAVDKFCSDMEGTPVGVIVGLFSAISQKLPSFSEWDTRKHHHLLNSNPAVCDAMTEVRAHVTKYENYLKSRADTKFDRLDFDCLSNKFLSKLVIRAN